jgi:nickel-dependent lactate racemase
MEQDRMLHFAEGSPTAAIDQGRSRELIRKLLTSLGDPERVLLVPPDFTRCHSGAGELTVMLYEQLGRHARVAILPALGTHAPMTDAERETMFPGIPASAFHVHDWRKGLTRLGEVPAAFVRDITAGRLDFPIGCDVNHLLVDEQWDGIISIGQVVPHEVAGMANHSKNIFVGVGGPDAINKTHFVAAVHGLEATMGRLQTPVRSIFEYMATHFARELPVTYLLTVRALDADGALVTRGLFAGDDDECLEHAAALSRRVNVELLDEPVSKAVVYLAPETFKSTWLGNKAVYRIRMVMADGGELIILAPGVATFGEDRAIDRLIRKYGYRGTRHTLRMLREHEELAANLSVVAHLIHGSTEGRFRVTYCPGKLSRAEVESVGFSYADPGEMQARYNPAVLRDGWNDVNGEKIFFVSNPGLGLWALEDWCGMLDDFQMTECDDVG